ncbi:pentapeptide repeat-containing protein [Streptomyces flaveus]|uniref:pentapeptide repeat-containing protein n=1 Tax=Streptomyces flaveus TaxID=66370 RepID=UPI00332350D6
MRLWPVGPVLALTFTTALLVAAAVFFAGWELLGARGLKPEHRIDSKTLFDLVKLSFGVVAGAGALVALVVAYRRQRVDEDGALRDATRLHTERFTTAVSQLGEDSVAVRLGGVHALAGLADDAPTRELRQTCIDVLCAYLRLPYIAEADLPQGDADARHAYLALREVRHTIIRLIRDHLRLNSQYPHSWQGHDLDFTGVVFDGGDFSSTQFSGGTVTFDGATFSGNMNFFGAEFSGGEEPTPQTRAVDHAPGGLHGERAAHGSVNCARAPRHSALTGSARPVRDCHRTLMQSAAITPRSGEAPLRVLGQPPRLVILSKTSASDIERTGTCS